MQFFFLGHLQVEALTEENLQLNRKLEFALGKIEVVCLLLSLCRNILHFFIPFIRCFCGICFAIISCVRNITITEIFCLYLVQHKSVQWDLGTITREWN